jgi:DNA-binding NarL/FixJ family response regulator
VSVRVLVVDDHPLFRDGLAASLAAMPEIEVVGVASDGPEAVESAAAGGVDVVLMDLNLPTMSGVQATVLTCALPDPPAVLVVTMVDDDDIVLAAMRAGARGYVLKGSTGEEIAAAVTTVASGGAVLGPGVATRLLDVATASRRGVASAFAGLTDREADVLALIGEGRSNQQIASALGLTVKTVQNYVSRILDKLQVRDRTQAALRVRDEQGGH